MAFVNVLTDDTQEKLATLLVEVTALVKDLRSEVAAIKQVRETVHAALMQKDKET